MELFDQPKYKRYSDIVRIDTIPNARKSAALLTHEYREAQNNTKKLRIIRVIVYTLNRINAILKRKTLSGDERYEFKRIYIIYNDLLIRIKRYG